MKTKILLFTILCSSVLAAVKPAMLSFNKGEVSPLLLLRSDFEGYDNSCKTLQNMLPLSQGPVMRRPGTYFIKEVKDSSKKVRLIPFEYAKTDAYIIEMGDEYMRFYRDGGQILDFDGSEDLSAVGSIVAHWKLNDDAATTVVVDADGATHNGTASANTNTFNADGVTNGALDMDGLHYASATDSIDFTFDDSAADAFSIMAWVYVVAFNQSQTIISKWDETTGSQAREWRIFLNSQEQLRFLLYDESANTFVSRFTDSPLSAGWNFIVGTYDGRGGENAYEGINLYVNSIAVDMTRHFSLTYVAMENTNANVIIGAHVNTSGNEGDFWQDKLDNIAV
ncbi:hypothetical protein LCGC14_1942220, partial [marine sediment metagenome]